SGHNNKTPEPPTEFAANFARDLMQGQLLHAPTCQFCDQERVGVPAIDLVDRVEFLEEFAVFSEFAKQFAVEFRLINLPVAGSGVKILVGAGRYTEGRGRAGFRDLRFRRSVFIEDLNAL